MLNADSNSGTRRYNTEIGLIDSLYEFHPEAFQGLAETGLRALREYYLIGCEVPENIFEYRASRLQEEPALEKRARRAFIEVCRRVGLRKLPTDL